MEMRGRNEKIRYWRTGERRRERGVYNAEELRKRCNKMYRLERKGGVKAGL